MLARKIDYDYYRYEQYTLNNEYEQQAIEMPKKVYNTKLRFRAKVLVFMVLSLYFCMVMRSDAFIQKGNELLAMKKQETEITRNIEYMQINLARDKAPQRIIALAEKNGMVSANKNLYISVASTEKVDKEKQIQVGKK